MPFQVDGHLQNALVGMMPMVMPQPLLDLINNSKLAGYTWPVILMQR
jgi:hypothetical protein